MDLGINTNYSNYSNTATQSQRMQSVSKEYGGENTQTLDDFKRDVYDAINKMPVHPSQSKTQISVNISDKAFEKMMNDSSYKDLMLRTIQRDLNGAYPSGGAAPSYSIITIGDDCEYRADAMGSAYGANFSAAQSTSFLQKNTKKASSDYDDFNRRKKQSQIDYQDIAAKKWDEKRLQEKRLSEKEYEEKLLEQKADQSLKMKKALDGYESNILTVTEE